MQGRMRDLGVVLAIISCAGPIFAGAEPEKRENPRPPVRGSSVAPRVVVGAALAISSADMAVTNSILRPNALKGSFGEAHMERHLAKQLGLTGKWVSLPARLGPHGLDGMAVQFDSAGEPCKLVVSEAKYGTGRLQMTSDGIQMGTAWRNVRLVVQWGTSGSSCLCRMARRPCSRGPIRVRRGRSWGRPRDWPTRAEGRRLLATSCGSRARGRLSTRAFFTATRLAAAK